MKLREEIEREISVLREVADIEYAQVQKHRKMTVSMPCEYQKLAATAKRNRDIADALERAIDRALANGASHAEIGDMRANGESGERSV